MKLIVGLWNPWKKYENTKHNVWFMFLDYLKNKENFSDFKLEKKFKWEISEWQIYSEKVILLKPQTFMNLSWESLIKIFHFYKIDKDDMIVIYDDMSMDFWKVRFRNKWSAGWHNGVKNIINHFTDQFKRIKVGIWFNSNYEVSDWVLSKFSKSEIEELNNNIFPNINELLKEKI